MQHYTCYGGNHRHSDFLTAMWIGSCDCFVAGVAAAVYERLITIGWYGRYEDPLC